MPSSWFESTRVAPIKPSSATKGLSVSNAVKTFTDFGYPESDLETITLAWIQARTAGVMITWDGTDPTTKLGKLIAKDASFMLEGDSNVRNLKLLREAGDDADVTLIVMK